MDRLKDIKQNKMLQILFLVVIGIPVGLLMVEERLVLNLGILLLFAVAIKQSVRKRKLK